MKKPYDQLKQARKNQHITQTELSKRLHIPQSHLSKIEAGKIDMRLSSFIELARSLGYEPMLIPKSYQIAVNTIISQEDPSEPAWQPDED